jgi:thiol:disulfide interchange protein DsbC
MRRSLLLIIAVTLALLSLNEDAFSFAKGEQDCTKCHTLDAAQAKDVLSGLIPDVKILEVRQGPINGLWEVAAESGGRKNIIYVDYSKKKVIAGNIFDIKTRTSYTQESHNRINKVDISTFPYENSLVMGDEKAKYRVVVFDDPD